MGFDASRFGTGIQAFGAGLAGRDPNVPVARYQEGIEREERKGNIAALMENMGISGNRGALIGMLPQQQQLAELMNIQGQRRASAAATAQAQQDAAAAAAANAEAMALMFPDTSGPQTAWDAAVSMPPTQPSFGQIPQTQTVTQSGIGQQLPVSDPSRLMDDFAVPGQGSQQMWINQDQPMGVPVPPTQGVTNLGDVTAGQTRADVATSIPVGPTAPSGDLGPMPAQMGGDQSLGGDRTLFNLMNARSNPNIGDPQKQYIDMLIEKRQNELGYGDEGTSLMQNYAKYEQQEIASGRPPLSLMDYQQALKEGTTVTVNTGPTGVDYGDPDAGFAWARDAIGNVVTEPDPETGYSRPVQVPYGGGKAEAAIAELAARDEAAAEQASLDLGKREADANSMLAAIDKVMKHPDLESIIGPIEGRRDTFFTQGPADALAAAGQLGGKVFMEAYQGLKGGGQITEIEGKQATNAIARLQRTQSPESYMEALQDLRTIVVKALDRVGGEVITPTAEPAAIRTYNPDTGRLE